MIEQTSSAVAPQAPTTVAEPASADPGAAEVQESGEARAPEFGGRDGPEPTRFGDWEKNGRCIDF